MGNIVCVCESMAYCGCFGVALNCTLKLLAVVQQELKIGFSTTVSRVELIMPHNYNS
jgi:hypothetical protein